MSGSPSCPERPAEMYCDLWLAGYQMAHLRTGRPLDSGLACVYAERQPLGGSQLSATAAAVEWMRRLARPPTAWVFPGILDFLALLILAPKGGLSPTPGRLTDGGRRTELLSPLLTGRPMVAEDIERMVAGACSVLRLLDDGQNRPAGEITVPFQLHGFGTEAGARKEQ